MFIINPYIISTALDPDAQAFITAASITDPTQQSAVNQLVLDLKAASLWTKMKAVYPFIGGSATSHKWNLKDPRDLDAAYRLSFAGGFTHDSNGIAGNASNAIANSFINPSTVLTNSNLHFSWYSRVAFTSQAYSAEISCDGSYSAANWITFRICNKTIGNAYFSAGNDSVAATVSQTQNGFFVGSETASNLRKLYRNGSAIATNTTSDTNSLPNLNLTLMGGGGSFSANGCSLATIGDGLTDTDVSNLYTAVQTFQTTLSRNV